MTPAAKLLLQQHTPQWLAERCVELEAEVYKETAANVTLNADNAALQLENERLQSANNDAREWIGDLKRQVEGLRELQAELEPYALRLEPEVVMYKSTPSLVPHAEALEKFLTIMRSFEAGGG